MSHNPYAPPEAVVEPAPAPLSKPMQLYEEPIRGGWLTLLLVMKFIGNVIAAITYLFVVCGVLSLNGRGPSVALAYLALVVTNITAIAAIWNWRRWGLYLLVVSAIVIFALNLSLGLLHWSTGIGLFGPLLVFAAMWPRWKSFE
jgi:hypothetical protein